MNKGKFSQGGSFSKARKRDLFFEEITRTAYKVNESLRRDVLEPLCSCMPLKDDRFEELEELDVPALHKGQFNDAKRRNENNWMWRAFLKADATHYPELVPIREAVIRWSRAHNLDADWCREIAIRTLETWSRKKDFDYWDCPLSGRYRLDPALEEALRPSSIFPRYTPFRHNRRDEYLQEVETWLRRDVIPQSNWYALRKWSLGSDTVISDLLDAQVEAEVRFYLDIAKRYCVYVDSYYESRGCSRISREPEELKHIKWAVEAQILGKTLASLAQRDLPHPLGETNTAYVSRAVKKVLEEIDLLPRPQLFRRGRPKKS